VAITLKFPQGLDAEAFLRDYWQQKPLLMRGALDFPCDLDGGDLAGLACEEGVESRMVLEKGGESPWELRHGPFCEATFGSLPESHWTLLVQDVDKFVPQVAKLIEPFRFLPDWRLDDVMVSYAVDQGSVGPHVDDYDVFLYQAQGRRRWKIHQRPVAEHEYIPGLDVRILPEFEADEEWLLEPGDCLYLPPNVAHWGVAEGECITCSVGFRAPTMRDMFAHWCDDLVENRTPLSRYRDQPLSPQDTPGEILPEVMDGLQERFREYLSQDGESFRRWFGRYITETKEHLLPEPDPELADCHQFTQRFQEQGLVYRNPLSRMAFSKGKMGMDSLFVNGQEYQLPSAQGGILAAITHYRELRFGYLLPWLDAPESSALLEALYRDGHLIWDEE
jgi:50S ribosomal protein L16 3-hydroxylase